MEQPATVSGVGWHMNLRHYDTSHGNRPLSLGASLELMTAWQAQFVTGGTRHGFKNQGAATVTIVETFVKT
jgi:hypothetical protein